MEIIDSIQEEHRTIKAVLRKIKKELVSLVIDQSVDKVVWAIGLAFIGDSVINFHHLKEREYLTEHRLLSQYKNLAEMINTIIEYHELVILEYNLLMEYWKLYQEGQNLARFNIMEEGEKLIRILEESMTLEEKLFDLTRNECIVK